MVGFFQQLQTALSRSPRAPTEPAERWCPRYQPTRLSHVTQIYADGKVDLQLMVYLPQRFSPAAPDLAEPQPLEQWCVQVKVGDGNWQTLERPASGSAYWSLALERLAPQTPLWFRYRDTAGEWQPLAPLNALENLYGTIYVPKLAYQWQTGLSQLEHASVLMETTLEGLLAGYKGGRFAPQAIEELLQGAIADRLLQTDIPGQLAEWGIDELMVPVSSSVADRTQLDPRFNYLTYNAVDLDWQIGHANAFMQLVDRFHACGIRIVPDLIFTHQVRAPFPGSLDGVARSDGEALFVDRQAYLFRDYGTWMFQLGDPEVRRQLVEKIVAFAVNHRLKLIRIDYVDGLVLQYANRDQNFAETFIRELRAELDRAAPDLIALGETFEVAGNPAVSELIDAFYAPIGFSIVEELYKPPEKRERPRHPNVETLVAELNQAANLQYPQACYAQLHDETWYDQHIVRGRPYVPWAYGGNPAELAKRQGESLVRMGELTGGELLDYVRRKVRNAEALTMFSAKLRYMFVPSVDSLALGCYDEGRNWQVSWAGVAPEQMAYWQEWGLSAAEIERVHRQHRTDMAQLRNIFRRYTKTREDTFQSFVQPGIYHCNAESSLLGVFRYSHVRADESLIALFNFGPHTFAGSTPYELPVPEGFSGQWTVLFDGDGAESAQAYTPGTVLETASGRYANVANVLPLRVGAMSLLVLRYCY